MSERGGGRAGPAIATGPVGQVFTGPLFINSNSIHSMTYYNFYYLIIIWRGLWRVHCAHDGVNCS